MDFIETEKKGFIGKITISREKALNALSSEVLDELKSAVSEFDEDGEVRCIVITGKGKAFVAGADIEQINNMKGEEGKEYAAQGQQTLSFIENIKKPVIAMINGYALGGGFELAMSCDIRVASKYAKFGLPEVTLGIIPGNGGTQRLPRLVGKGMAKYLIMTGEIIDAQTAKEMGAIDILADAETLEDKVNEIAIKIASNAPVAIQLAKKAINKSFECGIEDGILKERDYYYESFLTNDRKRGMDAFLNKESVAFEGD